MVERSAVNRSVGGSSPPGGELAYSFVKDFFNQWYTLIILESYCKNMEKIKALEVRNIFFIIILIGISLLAIQIFSPYFNILIVSFIIVQLFHPTYKFLLKTTRSKILATMISILLVFILFIAPLAIIIYFAVNEIQVILNNTEIISILRNNEFVFSINNFAREFTALISSLSSLNVSEIITALSGKEQTILSILGTTKDVLLTLGTILFNIFLLIISLIFIFPSYENLGKIFSKISPLDKKLDLLLFEKFKNTIRGVIKGSFLVAIMQATAVLIPLLLLNVGAPVLLWLIMVILSIIPIGSGLVWAPIGIGIIITGITSGDTGMVLIGLGLIVYGAVIINVIDTTFRPILMRNSVQLHPLVTILSVLGGIYFFGLLGIIYGPLIVVFFISIMEVYRHKFLEKQDEAYEIRNE